ncbi:MatE [Teratosphaeria destructans]|uniref:MatE n=1 Tax=Teratosphaeria destructans TaxID=418781 RepID=A0A9W7T038_9PEZI|nr:MatE [Teratosphaeria destructans]
MSKPIAASSPRRSSDHGTGPRSLGASYRSAFADQAIAAVAEESIAKDLEEIGDSQGAEDVENGLSRTTSEIRQLGEHSMAGHYRRPSYMGGAMRPFLGSQRPETIIPVEQDREAAISEERSLLRDNNIIPPKHPRRRESSASQSSGNGLMHKVSVPRFMRKGSPAIDEEAAHGGDEGAPSERTALLGRDPTAPYGGEGDPDNIDKKWEEAVLSGEIQTSWQRETKTLAKYSLPLVLTFVLQNSLTMTSIFTVGHIGKIELGAVSLGSMTANITGYAAFHGLATSLDTLCAQAYGSGNKKLVGLQLQRMVFFLWAMCIPIAIVWLAGTQILGAIVPEKEIAVLAGRYLKVLVFGAPGYACFESAKRYVQAQGHFAATMYVLLIAAPLNIFMHWLFVWQFQWGFIGCPIAVVITENLMPLLLFLYVKFFGGMECWPGFTRKAFRNWWPMIRLAIPGLVMVMAEFIAFEVLTLASARISATHLAAQTVLQTLAVLFYQFPFPLSIATSTRVANLIGASLPDAAKVTGVVAVTLGTIIGIINMVVLASLRNLIPRLFSNDPDVITLAAATLPICASFQLFDSLAAQMNGLLRGLGKQEIGGYIGLFAYYVVAIPFSFGTAFGLHWDLMGLWAGPAIALAIVAITEGIYVYRTSWSAAAEEAAKRNAAG